MEKVNRIADELGDLRALIRTLKAREAELRRRIIEHRPNAPLEGARFSVTIKASSARRFCPALLPDHIRNDERYIKRKSTRYVIAKPHGQVPQNMK
tara:strand:- start:82 stop:369 length:288 start_codon:yes stop_codon:yes gene_type:complete